MKKHIGKLKTTDKRCVVINPSLPGKEEYALVVDTDALPDKFHDSLMAIVESAEGQGTKVIGDLLSRRRYQDTNMDMLKTLHEAGRLQVIKNDEVIMLPMPNHPYILKDILEHDPDYVQKMASLQKPKMTEEFDADSSLVIPVYKEKPLPTKEILPDYYIPTTPSLDPVEAKKDATRKLLIEAEMLELEAKKKRLEAYRFNPNVMPELEAQVEKLVPKPVEKVVAAPEIAPVLSNLDKVRAKVVEKIKKVAETEEPVKNILTGTTVKTSGRGRKKTSIVG